MAKYQVAAAIAALTLGAAGATGAQASVLLSSDFSAGLSGWTVIGDVAALTGAQYGACCGVVGSEPNLSTNVFASFGSGNVSGLNEISRAFNTVAGRLYTVSFDNGAFGQGSQALIASLNGVSQGSYNGLVTNNVDTTFTTQTFSFVGDGAQATLAFHVTTSPDNVDALLDNVSVSAVPEPATWAMMIIGFGAVGGAARSARRRQAAFA